MEARFYEAKPGGGKLSWKKKADVTLPGVSVNGDGSFLEEATQIQIQKSKEKSARQERMGTHDRRVEKEGMESYVFEDNVESVGSDEWGPQTGKWAMQNEEQQEVTSPMKTQNGPNEEMYTNIEGEKAQTKKGKWKKLARGKLKNTKAMMEITESTVGTKHRLLEDEITEDEGRKKRI